MLLLRCRPASLLPCSFERRLAVGGAVRLLVLLGAGGGPGLCCWCSLWR